MSFFTTAIRLIRDHPYNYTVTSAGECTLDTCSITQGQYTYDPSLTGNVVLAVLFGVLLILHITLGIYYRTTGFTIAILFGFGLEMVGYIGRTQMHFNPFIQQPFMMELICVTIGPVFIAAAIYLCLSRIVVVYGTHLSRLSPGAIAIIFMVSDFISLLLQTGGGVIVEIANDVTVENAGIHVAVAGLAFQVASLCVFLALCADFTVRCLRDRHFSNIEFHQKIRAARLFKCFLSSLLLATLAILLRSTYRIFELQGGFHGTLWNDEVDFIVLDGGMVALAGLCLTILHPGLAFHGYWEAANFKLKSKGCCGRGRNCCID